MEQMKVWYMQNFFNLPYFLLHIFLLEQKSPVMCYCTLRSSQTLLGNELSQPSGFCGPSAAVLSYAGARLQCTE